MPERKTFRSYVRSYIRIMGQGWGSLEEGNFIFPSSTGWVLATVYILLGCVKAIMNLGTGGSIPNQMIAGPGFPRSSQALRSRACRRGWSWNVPQSRDAPTTSKLVLGRCRWWSQKHMKFVVYLIYVALLTPLPGGPQVFGISLALDGTSGYLWAILWA